MRLDDINELHEWMRRKGATYARVGDVELSLGRAPDGPPGEAPAPLTDEQVIARAKRRQERQERLLFASSEGFPEDDEDDDP